MDESQVSLWLACSKGRGMAARIDAAFDRINGSGALRFIVAKPRSLIPLDRGFAWCDIGTQPNRDELGVFYG
jgi:hypothetical protein